MFYDNFIRACNLLGKTPSAVLLEVGLGKSAGTRWKRGENPTDATVQKLADYFGISPSDLTGDTHLKVTTGAVLDQSGISQEAIAIAKAYERADDRTRQIVKLALEPFGLSVGEP